MERKQFIVGARVVAWSHERTRRQPRHSFVAWAVLVVGNTRNTESTVGLSPPPKTAKKRLATRRAWVTGVHRRQVQSRGRIENTVTAVTVKNILDVWTQI